MACDCIETINAELDKDGQRLDTAISFGQMKVMTYTNIMRADTGKEERRRGKPSIFAHTFCPFCGTKCVEEPEQKEQAA